MHQAHIDLRLELSSFLGPIASMFWLDKELGSDIFLDGTCHFFKIIHKYIENYFGKLLFLHSIPIPLGVVTLVDAKNGIRVSTMFYL